MDNNLVLAGELDGARLKHAGTAAGKLEHVVVRDAVELLGAGGHTRVGRVDALYVGIDLAHIGTDAAGKGHSRGVGAATAQRGDVAIRGNALETRDHHDSAGIKGLADAIGVDVFDLGSREGIVGGDAGLPAGEADGAVSQRLDGHGQKRHANLLARGEQHIHLALGGVVVQCGGKPHQFVGGFAHRGNHGHNIVALLLHGDKALGHVLDAFRGCNGSAPELGNYKRHRLLSLV